MRQLSAFSSRSTAPQRGLAWGNKFYHRLRAVARGMPGSASLQVLPFCHSEASRTVLPFFTLWPHYHIAQSAILKCPQSSCDHECNSNNFKKKKKSFSIHLSEIVYFFFFFPSTEWVEACPGRALEADMFERALRKIYEHWDGWRRWMWRVFQRVLVFQQAMWPAWTSCQKKAIRDKSDPAFYRTNVYLQALCSVSAVVCVCVCFTSSQ